MKNIIKSTLLLGALCGATASTVEAADCCYPCQPSCCEWSFCDGKFTVGANYLYWQSEQDDVYVVETTTPGTATATTSTSNRIHAPKFDYESGYRVYAVYELPCDQWELGVAYTYAPGKAGWHDFNVTEGYTIENGRFSTFGFKWNSNLNYLDLDIARTLKFGECFRLRPHIGFRAAWGDQEVIASGTLTTPTANFNEEHTFFKGRFNAYGVEGGLWGEWNLFCNLSLVGHFGGSILFNEVHNKLEVEDRNVTATGTSVFSNTETRYKDNVALPTLDYFVGLRWEDCFCDWDFSVYAGWESHVWFDLAHFNEIGDNYSTQGLTAGIDVSF